MLRTKTTDTWEGKIYIGDREGTDGESIGDHDVRTAIRRFQSKLKFPVRLTKTSYLLEERDEGGWEIATMRYPLDTKEIRELKEFLQNLTTFLLKELKQTRIIAVYPDDTILYELKNPPVKVQPI